MESMVQVTVTSKSVHLMKECWCEIAPYLSNLQNAASVF